MFVPSAVWRLMSDVDVVVTDSLSVGRFHAYIAWLQSQDSCVTTAAGRLEIAVHQAPAHQPYPRDGPQPPRACHSSAYVAVPLGLTLAWGPKTCDW